MNFGDAIVHMQEGARASRSGWNGKGMYVYIEDWRGVQVDLAPCFVMRTATGDLQPGWLASQADMLADDWGVVP